MLENCPPESCIGARCRKVHPRVLVRRRTPAWRAIATRFCTTTESGGGPACADALADRPFRSVVGERPLAEEVAVSRGSQAECHFNLEVFRLWLERIRCSYGYMAAHAARMWTALRWVLPLVEATQRTVFARISRALWGLPQTHSACVSGHPFLITSWRPRLCSP